MREEPADALSKLITDAKLANLKITPLSGFRSYDTQVSVYSNEVKSFGQAVADTESARPGTSEHQTGLTVDVGGGGCGIEDCFGSTPEGKWVAQNAYKYGFIIRYPEGKQSTTGYRYEPWHLRFVGTDLANEMHSQKILTLEEFFGLPQAPQYTQN
jgi:D-alanyl-D-alanine carboxypeptidase